MEKLDLLQCLNAYEESFNCYISFHDFTGDISTLLNGELALYHNNPYCEEIRSQETLYRKCLDCDVIRVNETLAEDCCFIKCCHSRMAELVLPIMKFGHAVGVMFIGVFEATEEMVRLAKIVQPSDSSFVGSIQPEVILPDEIVRLDLLGRLLVREFQQQLEDIPQLYDRNSRKNLIHWFFVRNFRRNTSLDELAHSLSLGTTRTSNLLRLYFNQSFPEILTQYRLECAANILKNSSLPMSKVAELSGFSSTSYFHRCFFRKHSQTPSEYRNLPKGK